MTWTYCIDISGACNLACPSCPSRGFSFGPDATETRPSVRLMSVDLFSALMEKIVLENPNGDVDVCLYVWGEPLLHNKIGAIITMVRERGFNCVVATNLNATKHLADLVQAGPTGVSLSCSGFSKETYNVTHKDGDANLFISNLFLLRHLMDKHGKAFPVGIHYHLYNSNAHEITDLRRYAELLGFHWGLIPAYLTTLEEVRAVLSGVEPPPAIQGALDRMIFQPKELQTAAAALGAPRCEQLENRITIMADGSVLQCCGVSNPKYTVAPSYLDISRDEVQRLRNSAEICRDCFETGFPVWYDAIAQTPEFRLRIERTIDERDSPRGLLAKAVKRAIRSVPAAWYMKERLRGRSMGQSAAG